ncbi:MAG: hypothetical protein AAF719_10885 [Pseudomonadota bacterium]
MADIMGLAASAAGGGVFGLIGTLLGRGVSILERRQEYAQEQARWAHEASLLQLQMQKKRTETEAELLLADASGSWSGLRASMEAEAAIGASYKWVNAVRGLTRPVLTVLLWGVATLVFFSSDAAARGAIIETATFAATAATLWWFGDRGVDRFRGYDKRR